MYLTWLTFFCSRNLLLQSSHESFYDNIYLTSWITSRYIISNKYIPPQFPIYTV